MIKAMIRATTRDWNHGFFSDLGALTSRPFLPKIHASLARWLLPYFSYSFLIKPLASISLAMLYATKCSGSAFFAAGIVPATSVSMVLIPSGVGIGRDKYLFR